MNSDGGSHYTTHSNVLSRMASSMTHINTLLKASPTPSYFYRQWDFVPHSRHILFVYIEYVYILVFILYYYIIGVYIYMYAFQTPSECKLKCGGLIRYKMFPDKCNS